jgi:hypothetical protein
MSISSGEMDCKYNIKNTVFTYHFHQSEKVKDWLLLDSPIPTSLLFIADLKLSN